MPWEDGCAARAVVGGRQDSYAKGQAIMRDDMQPPAIQRQSSSSARSFSLPRSSSASLDTFRHMKPVSLRGRRRGIAQETQDLRALRRAPRPAPSVSLPAETPVSPFPKRHRGRIETPADHIASDVSSRAQVGVQHYSMLPWR